MNIIQITDLHLCRNGEKAFLRADANQALKDTVEYFLHSALNIDMIVVSGDVSTDGSLSAYQAVRQELSRLPCPVYFIPGNHDCREHMQAVGFLPAEPDYSPCRKVETEEASVILLDTLKTGESRGIADKVCLEQLSALLSQDPQKPTFLFMHHVPFATGYTMMDEPIDGVGELQTLIAEKPLTVCCGHIHAAMVTRMGLSNVITCPPVCMEMELDLSEKGGDMFYTSPPQFALHCVKGQEVISHFVTVPTQNSHQGPYTFSV